MKVHAFEISDHWYLEAADFLGALCQGGSGYPAWKEAEMYLGATAAGRAMLAQRRYPRPEPYLCPHCGSRGFLREDDGRCSFCSGRENGACIQCEKPCPGDVCEWCGKSQKREGER